jgi:hypothetical protein
MSRSRDMGFLFAEAFVPHPRPGFIGPRVGIGEADPDPHPVRPVA